MCPEALAFIVRREAEPRPEVMQDIGGLADYKISMLEKRRRELRMLDIRSFQIGHHRIRPQARSALACDIDVIGPRFLEREPHEFAASLIGVSVVQLVSHFSPPVYCQKIFASGTYPCRPAPLLLRKCLGEITATADFRRIRMQSKTAGADPVARR